VGVEQPIDEVEVARAATPGADRQPAGELRLGARGEGRGFLVPDLDPRDPAMALQRVDHRIEAVPHKSVDAFDPSLGQVLDQFIRQGSCQDPHSSDDRFNI
jgi:hypothetical protein